MQNFKFAVIALVLLFSVGCLSVVVVDTDAVKSFNKATVVATAKYAGVCVCPSCKCVNCKCGAACACAKPVVVK